MRGEIMLSVAHWANFCFNIPDAPVMIFNLTVFLWAHVCAPTLSKLSNKSTIASHACSSVCPCKSNVVGAYCIRPRGGRGTPLQRWAIGVKPSPAIRSKSLSESCFLCGFTIITKHRLQPRRPQKRTARTARISVSPDGPKYIPRRTPQPARWKAP